MVTISDQLYTHSLVVKPLIGIYYTPRQFVKPFTDIYFTQAYINKFMGVHRHNDACMDVWSNAELRMPEGRNAGNPVAKLPHYATL